MSRLLKPASILAFAAAVLMPLPATAQALQPGTWSGAMSAPGGRPIPVSFEVAGSAGAISIVMSAIQVEDAIPFNDIRLQGDELTFWWEPGVRVDCTLRRTGTGGFEGTCSDGTGTGDGTLQMVPPGA